MFGSSGVRLVCAAILTVGMVSGPGASAVADEPPVSEVGFPAGVVCEFGLHVAAFGDVDDPGKMRNDKDGNIVQKVASGVGYDLVFTNVSTSMSVTTKANGSNNWTTTRSDGTTTTVLTGHNIVFMFPTDVPAGPSTTLYVGRVVIEIDAAGVYTLTHVAGRQFDICAALSA
jgi:hypothetical protein